MSNHRGKLAAIAAGGGAIWWLARRPVRVAVEGASMAPTLLAGDWLLATRGRPRRGSLVLVEHPARPGFEMVKRLVALPGDETGGRVLGPDEHWVLGDDPANSTDSRSFGPVSARHLRGTVRARYWPPRRAGRVR